MVRNPENYKLKSFWQGQSIRLSDSDRSFFQDLARVRIIGEGDADQFHYKDRKAGCKNRLEKFVRLGLIQKYNIHHPGRGHYHAYSFSNQDFAKSWGGKTPVIGAKRTALHEVMVSKLYFAVGQPLSFKLESQLNAKERECFREEGASKPMAPDAIMRDEYGNIVALEADSGQYTKSQVNKKMNAWSGIKQVWGQPLRAAARIESNESISVMRF